MRWQKFGAETGTLSVPRAEMPQIKAEHRGAMVNFLKAKGIEATQEEVPAADLKPTQAEYSPPKVRKAQAFKGGERSILVSSDGHVLDGHHQWLAKIPGNQQVKVIRLDAPIKDLLATVKEFPSATQEAGATTPTNPSPTEKANGPQADQAQQTEAQQPQEAGAGPAAAADAQPVKQAPRLDHGELNIPGRTSGINAELDRYKAEQKAKQNALSKEAVASRKENKAAAKAKFDEMGAQMIADMARAPKLLQAGAKAAEIRKTIESMVKWEPAKFLDLAAKYEKEKAAGKYSEPAEAAAKPAKPKLKIKSISDAENARAAYFTPGNVIKGYGGFDEVLSYTPPKESGDSWSVLVHRVEKVDGKWVREGRPQDARSHATHPSSKDLADGPVDRLAYQSASEVAYSETRADGKPHPNAAERGVNPSQAPKADESPQSAALQVDSPAVGALNNAIDRKEKAWKLVKSLRAQVKEGRADLRVELIKAESEHRDELRYVKAAQEQVAQDALKAGLITKKGAAQFSRAMTPEEARAFLEALAKIQAPPAMATVESVRAAVAEITGMSGKLPNELGRVVVSNASDIKTQWVPMIGMQASLEGEGDQGKALAFYDPRTKTVFLIADHIKAGTEHAVVMHELMHKWGKEVIGKDGWDRIHGEIKNWENAPAGSAEAEIYSIARNRVESSAGPGGPTQAYTTEELFPYAVQTAIEMGIKPNAMAREGTASKWLAKVKRMLQDVWAKITGKPGSMTAQQMVDLAFGIAQAENPAFGPGLIGAIGSPNENGSMKPQFSRATVANLKQKAQSELQAALNVPGKLSWWHKTIGTMYNLAERSPEFAKVFNAAQSFIDDVSYYASEAADLAPKLLPKLENWRDIGKSPISAADNKAISAPIFEGTLSWGRDESGKAVPIDDLKAAANGLTAEQKAQRLLRTGKISDQVLKMWQGMPVEQFEKLVASRFESQMLQPGVVWTPEELRTQFGLSDAQIDLYKEFRATTDKSIDTMARADMLRFAGKDAAPIREAVMEAKDAQEAATMLRDYLLSLAKENPDRAETLAATANGMIDRADKVRDLQAKGYAPLSRFGKYTVDVLDAGGQRQYFGLFETAREARAMANRMRAEFQGGVVTQGTLSEAAFKQFSGITPESLELFGNMLGLNSTGDEAADKAFQQYLQLTKTNRSAMKRLIHRKGIAGYSEDVGRVLASFVYSNARQTAAGLHLGDLGDAVNAIPKEMGELKDAAIALADYIKNPQEEAQAIRGLLFAQYLGGSVASAMVNMTQPIAVSFPWLSQFGGAKQAGAQLIRAMKGIASNATFEPDLAEALKRAEEDGTVSPQEVHQLMAQARGSGALRSGDGSKAGNALAAGQNAMSRLSLAWGKVFGFAEQANRQVTFIAAYRIAKAQGIADPAGFAKKAVQETQFVYSKASKMVWGRGAIGGTLMTFKTYSIAYLELLHRMYTRGGPEGKKAAMLALATMAMMGGAGGLPFADDMDDIFDAIAQMFGYNLSSKKARQEFLEGLVGRAGADFIERGVTGLPGSPIDVSGRLGMGNLIPGTGLLMQKTDHTSDLLELAGPAGDMAKRFFQAGGQAAKGDIGAAALSLAPKAASNAAKGVDMLNTGAYRDDKGYKVLDTTTLEAAAKAIGFQPATVSKMQEANSIHQREKAFYNLVAQDIRAKWARGIFEKDADAVAEARDQIADWNTKNPDQRIAPNVPAIMKRVREMGKSKDERIAATAPKAMRAEMRRETQAAREGL